MGTGFIHNRSGGATLNFAVKAYASEEELLAATPKENTIGVVTENKIVSWIFSEYAPSEAVDGMVWIQTGTSSDAEFDALKKNTLSVYPLKCRQYISGIWDNRIAYIYKNGAWVQFSTLSTYLYDAGNEYVDITGGWESLTGGGSGTKIAEKQSDGLYMKCVYSSGSAASYVGWYAVNAINFDSINEIVMTLVVSDASRSGWTSLRINNTSGQKAATPETSGTVAYADAPVETGDIIVSLDTSGITGDNYIGIYTRGGSGDNSAEMLIKSIEYRE